MEMIEILVLTAVIVGLSFAVLYFMQKSIVDESDPEIKKYKNDADEDKDASYNGNSSGYSKIRICEGASSYSIAYFIDDNKVYNACTSIYDAEYTIEGKRVYKEGSVAYTVDENKIYRGTDICSENIVYTIDGNNILRGTGSYPTEIVYNIIYE